MVLKMIIMRPMKMVLIKAKMLLVAQTATLLIILIIHQLKTTIQKEFSTIMNITLVKFVTQKPHIRMMRLVGMSLIRNLPSQRHQEMPIKPQGNIILYPMRMQIQNLINLMICSIIKLFNLQNTECLRIFTRNSINS
uniref:Uncharacterized protein n=1 Tax=Cacopsylla melanoneura TaxID=428564 RepID=A0A8D8VY50_9HEMI